MRKQLALTAAMLGIAALALTGCGSTEPAESDAPSPGAEGGEIAFFAVSGQIPVVQSLADTVTEYLGEQGYTVTVYDANFDPVEQAQQIQQAVETKSIVGAWVFPVAAETLGDSVEALQSAGIPVVLESSHVNFGFDGAQPGIVFNEPAFEDYGTAIGKEASECATESGASGALFLEAPAMAAGTDVVHDRIIENYTATEILANEQAADTAAAQTVVSQLLLAHPDADVVIGASDETALGAVGAYKAAGKTPKCVIAGGGGPDAIAAQEAGDITAVVSIDYDSSATAAADDLVRLIGDPSQEGILNSTPIKIVK